MKPAARNHLAALLEDKPEFFTAEDKRGIKELIDGGEGEDTQYIEETILEMAAAKELEKELEKVSPSRFGDGATTKNNRTI